MTSIVAIVCWLMLNVLVSAFVSCMCFMYMCMCKSGFKPRHLFMPYVNKKFATKINDRGTIKASET